MAPCPSCGTELEYVQQYGKYYCRYCQQYHDPVIQPSQPYPAARGTPIPVIIAVVVVILVVIGGAFFLFTSSDENDDNGYGYGDGYGNGFYNGGSGSNYDVYEFPTIEINIKHSAGSDENRVIVRHIGGDSINWQDYKIVIRNESNEADTVTMSSISGELKYGEAVVFTDDSASANSLSSGYYVSFGSFDFTIGYGYTIEIYHLEMAKLVHRSSGVTCTSF